VAQAPVITPSNETEGSQQRLVAAGQPEFEAAVLPGAEVQDGHVLMAVVPTTVRHRAAPLLEQRPQPGRHHRPRRGDRERVVHLVLGRMEDSVLPMDCRSQKGS
jgi:hypothetical protein